MSYVDLTEIEVQSDRPQFEKFDVEKNDKARIMFPSGMIVQHWVHVLHSDVPEMVEGNYGKLRPQWSRESFAGSVICTGDAKTVARNPKYGDPEGCPACAAMQDERGHLVETPKKTYAMNVIKYATKPGTNLPPLRNLNVEVQLWKHADKNKINPIIEAAQQVPVDKIDFLITADNSDWKKYTIGTAADGSALYLQNEDLGKAVEEAKKDLYDEDTLTAACGKKLSKDELAAEVKSLFVRLGATAVPTTPEATGTVSIGGNSLVEAAPATQAAAAPAAASLLVDDAPADAVAVAEAAVTDLDVSDFTNMLKGE